MHLSSQNLSSRILGNVGLEAHLESDNLVFGEPFVAVIAQFLHNGELSGILGHASLQNNMRNGHFFLDFGENVAKNTDISDKVICEETGFDFCGRDLPTTELDYVLLAVCEVELLVVREVTDVAS